MSALFLAAVEKSVAPSLTLTGKYSIIKSKCAFLFLIMMGTHRSTYFQQISQIDG